MHRAVTLVASLLLAGCVGTLTEGNGGGGGGDDTNLQPDAGTPSPDAQIVDLKAILSQWSGCMTLANFQAANMAQAWSTLITNDGKQCLNCHDQGEYNFIASDDENAFFAGVSQHSYFMLKYFAVDTATMKVVVSTASFASANAKVGHPKFNYSMNAGITALTAFHASTAANTACGAPTMID
jgi:hypothetical protein